MKLDRRQFFKISAVGGAAVGLDACSTVVPAPRGRPLRGPESHVVTACGACSAGCGISVRVVGKDVVGIQGVPGHPVNDGALCARGVAEIQNLYHPERLRGPLALTGERGGGQHVSIDWDTALNQLAERGRGAKVVVGIGDCTAAERALVERIAAGLGAIVVSARPPYSEFPVDAMRGLLGSDRYRYDLGNARYVLSLGADWVATSPSPMDAQRAFGRLRRLGRAHAQLVTVGPRLSTTAGKSDRWIPVRSDQIELVGLSLAHAILKAGPAPGARDYPGFDALAAVALADEMAPARVAERIGVEAEAIERTAAELLAAQKPVVVTDRSDRAIQWIGLALNLLVGAVDREGGLIATERAPLPKELEAPRPLQYARQFPSELSDAVVLIVRANPVYALPATSGWRAGLERASYVVAVSSYLDETALLADLVLPPSSALESRQLAWRGRGAEPGFVTGGPAVLEPLYDTRPAVDILLAVAGNAGVTLPWGGGGEYLETVAKALSADQLLGEGGFAELESSAGEPEAPELPQEEGAVGDGTDGAIGAAPAAGPSESEPPPPPPPAPRYRLVSPDWPAVAVAPGQPASELPLRLEIHEPGAFRGGLGAHLPYLHGLTDGFEREVWRTIAEINTSTARALGIEDGEPVTIVSASGRIDAIARTRRGVRPDAVAVATGLGRRCLGFFSEGHGANPLELVDDQGPTFVRMEKKS